ncbi:hypothetical protein WH43_07455 [Rheinheimera sp. KL1]|uniref:DUF4041 domain-containing protein n=1 Tax=Rheinheimera sp. KL1 TaxID=1635005 RepID=UPI0006A99C53|nr:DUF4041 domain-containing protein [Rheinheimera sp. KL1]KOO58682.1 hypothetical protein WH43_07455 [Rheinheimera sp. KL1]
MDNALLTTLVFTCIFIVLVLIIRSQSKRNKSFKSQVSALLAERSALQQVIREQEIDVATARELISQLELKTADLSEEVQSLSRFCDIRDTTQELERLQTVIARNTDEAKDLVNKLINDANQDANQITEQARIYAETLRREVSADAKLKREKVQASLDEANTQASLIISKAQQNAEEIAGDAYRALREADRLEAVIEALKNTVTGYGDEHLKPTYGLLDELAEMYAFKDAGQELKRARERTKLMVTSERAATCDYVERNRAVTAINFVIDAFNGKVDSVLSRSKTDNFGKLEAEIRDAFALVNHNGKAFRSARINEEYLQSRLDELHWLTAVNLIREQEKEEQRRIREQIREEEKARREYERAIKDAAKEEAAIQKALEKLQSQLEKASEDQRAEFEAKLADLQQKLVDAESKNQRALSMAQQTKTGHVYIISNLGSFGENVYKVGMTRRLEPLDRVKELGDASVPFPFDVHAMIWSEDAPALERDLHRYFLRAQLNKVNPRKEFFRLNISDIKSHIEERGQEAVWTLQAEAAEYRETLEIEKRIEEDPLVAAEWTRHQIELAIENKQADLSEDEDIE